MPQEIIKSYLATCPCESFGFCGPAPRQLGLETRGLGTRLRPRSVMPPRPASGLQVALSSRPWPVFTFQPPGATPVRVAYVRVGAVIFGMVGYRHADGIIRTPSLCFTL